MPLVVLCQATRLWHLDNKRSPRWRSVYQAIRQRLDWRRFPTRYLPRNPLVSICPPMSRVRRQCAWRSSADKGPKQQAFVRLWPPLSVSGRRRSPK